MDRLSAFYLFLVLPLAVSGVQPLGKYSVDRTKITTSGISSGASMATQMHVAYSGVFSGAGMIAGSIYWCAKGTLTLALNACMNYPQNIDVADYVSQAESYAARGDIDPLSNLADDKVFILSGTEDTVVDQGESAKAQEFYGNFMTSTNIKTVYDLPAGHTFPTIDYGNACSIQASPFMGRCQYDSAYEMLNYFYGNLQKPSGTVPLLGQFYEFDQVEFFDNLNPHSSSMDDVGYVYVPSGCLAKKKSTCADIVPEERVDCGTSGITSAECLANGCCYDDTIPNVKWCFQPPGSGTAGACKLHVAYHGCKQGRYTLGDEFARNAGYNEVGELNNIIILYPQAISLLSSNPNGCWDWWGYTVSTYATKGGDQPLACWRMVEQIAY